MSFELVVIGVVLIFLIAAIAAKEWEKHARKQYEAEQNIGDRRIFRSRKR